MECGQTDSVSAGRHAAFMPAAIVLVCEWDGCEERPQCASTRSDCCAIQLERRTLARFSFTAQ
ncbi:MAG: hypothetical protein VYA30_03000 [Myxococcota bacterium]|nr:hypothetical protein [Myxococcota bacterium]